MQIAALDYTNSNTSRKGKSNPRFRAAMKGPALSFERSDLETHVKDYLFSCECASQSEKTIEGKRGVYNKFAWFLDRFDYEQVSATETREFIRYVMTAHTKPEGRWDKKQFRTKLSPSVVRLYYAYLSGFFNWLVAEDILQVSLLERVSSPKVLENHIQPFQKSHVDALLKAAKRSLDPLRNEAIIVTLLDTGLRASELCSLKWSDIDWSNRSVVVLGKDNTNATWHRDARYDREN